MVRTSAGLQEKRTASARGRERCRGVIAVSFLAACALVAEASCGFVVGGNTLATAKRPQRSVKVFLRNYAVGEQVQVLRSDKSWHRGVVQKIGNDGTTHVSLSGGSMKSIPKSRTHVALKKIEISPANPPRRPASAGSAASSASAASAGAPRAIDASAKKYIMASIRHDLENQFTDGFVFTPLRSDVSSSNPFMSIRGKYTSDVLKQMSPLVALNNFMVEGAATFHIKSIVETSGDINPFENIASPPRGKLQDRISGAAWAIHAAWEIEAEGRIQLSGVFEQKPFYLSGHDVFRMDASGKVISHEKGFDQELASVVHYFNPFAHIPSLDSILPISVAQKD